MDANNVTNVDTHVVDNEVLYNVISKLQKEECEHKYECINTTSLTVEWCCRKCGHKQIKFRNLYPGY